MKRIRQKQATAIRDIATEAIKEALANDGLEVEARGMIWSASQVKLTIDITLPGVAEDAAKKRKDEARKLCPNFGLSKNAFDCSFYLDIKKSGTLRVKIVDIKPRNHKYPIIVEVINHAHRYHGKRFKCSAGHVRKALAK